ncbi:Crp/Fnr family transcriptional regulator [Pseudooceanicola sp. CBS1P-1]|uniref:Cyclic nucleotide-binding domain-containing protein n=1 Tax=Pseudooceanicola albus TaxID=2692189 RepID=A0A6L7G3Y2_9RHOB|nr:MULTISPECIES: Crp/Fnr family transcriptional regulator [Pseudooceanicola]MBT9385129.1 Crp/Fnr family transcriptional regulator [Pseudooceanicola endophyticus]MXN18579.1 cyclic nucleotide-binding domain-containing protein [Pseudooceanicola albus]
MKRWAKGMTEAEIAELGQLPLLAGVPADLLRAPALRWTRRHYDAGQIVFDRDSRDGDVYFVRSGAVMAIYWTADGRELVFSKMGPGSYLGELAALDDGPRSVSIYAQQPTEVLVLGQAGFLWLLEEVPALKLQIIRDLSGRVRALTERVAALLSQSVEERVRGFLARLALETGQFHPGGLINGAPTHAEIAGNVGANREAVSRTMSALARAGIIETARQKITILVPEALQAGTGTATPAAE